VIVSYVNYMAGLNNDAILTCQENKKSVYQVTDLNKIPIVFR